MNPQTHSMDLSKFVRKSELEASQKCLVENADNKDEYIHKNQVPYQPKIDLDKYVLKSSIPPQKECPPQKEIDYSKYVLKSSIPPVQKCPPCICPKVKVSAGLCQKCPPPPKCPAPEACPPPPSCPEPKPCPQQKQEVLHKIKYIKVPTLIQKDTNNNTNNLNNSNNSNNPNNINNMQQINNPVLSRQQQIQNMYTGNRNNPKINQVRKILNNSIKQQRIPVYNELVHQNSEIVQEESDDLNNIPNYHLNQKSNNNNKHHRMFELNSKYSNSMTPIRGNPGGIGF